MSFRLLSLPLAALLAFGVAVPAVHAADRKDQAVLPVVNNGKVEALLVLEPADGVEAGGRWRFGNNSLDATFGLDAGDSLALLCNRANGVGSALGALPNNCMLATLGDNLEDNGSRRTTLGAALNRGNSRLGVSVGSGRDTLPAWLTPGTHTAGKVDINDLTVVAQKNLSSQGYVSIAGTVAKARLAPITEFPALADRWSSRSLSVGGGFGPFGASIVGHVLDAPGQPRFEGLGLGLTWRTPWSGQLTVGADNVITRGKNPFSPSVDGEEEGTVPYVRYEQDL